MKIPIDIRTLYKPTQPASNLPADGVTYFEFLPDQRLQPFIYFYWELRSNEPLKESMTCKIVADGCIDIFFELNNPQDNFVIGFCKKYTEFPIGNSFHYVGVRFLPTMFAQLYNIDSSELSNRIEHLNIVVPQIATFITDSFSVKQGINEIKSIFDNYFNRVLTKTKIDFDPRLYESLNIILRKHGNLNIETELDTGISPRQLRRLFEFYIGDSAKTFSKVVRFQNILRAKPSIQRLRENKLFFDVGYYDQTHFIKEFKNFYGATPGVAFR